MSKFLLEPTKSSELPDYPLRALHNLAWSVLKMPDERVFDVYAASTYTYGSEKIVIETQEIKTLLLSLGLPGLVIRREGAVKTYLVVEFEDVCGLYIMRVLAATKAFKEVR